MIDRAKQVPSLEMVVNNVRDYLNRIVNPYTCLEDCLKPQGLASVSPDDIADIASRLIRKERELTNNNNEEG